MSKKLEGNGLHESSRMMLPEHKEQLISHFKQQQKAVRPELDPQQLEYITAAIVRSVLDQTPVTLVTFDIVHYEKEITGIVVKLDQQLQRLKMENEHGAEWLPFYDVLSVRELE